MGSTLDSGMSIRISYRALHPKSWFFVTLDQFYYEAKRFICSIFLNTEKRRVVWVSVVVWSGVVLGGVLYYTLSVILVVGCVAFYNWIS